MVMPVAGALLFIQGMAQVCRCYICIKTGEWPTHLEDVEEMEDYLAMQHEEELAAAKKSGLKAGGIS